MKATPRTGSVIDLVISKLLGALPPLANAQSNFYRLQVLILLRVIKAAGIQRIYAT